MFAKAHPLPPTTARRLLAVLLSLSLYGCAAGPDFVPPTADAPEDWSSWRSVDAALRALPNEGDSLSSQLPADWWLVFDDQVLNDLQQRALSASPDLQTAALHFAQARVQRSTVAAQRGVDVGVSAGVSRQRQSEYGAGTRMLDLISSDRALAELLSEPFNLYQSGFDASW